MVDHVVPLSKGGTNNPGNLALSCFHCNRRKADRMMATDPNSGEEVSFNTIRGKMNGVYTLPGRAMVFVLWA